MWKKFIPVFCVMVMGMMLSMTHAFALTEGDWEFQLLDSEVTITGYTGSDEDIVVPATLAGTPVTKVETFNIKDLPVVSITFPSSVRSIEGIFMPKDNKNQYYSYRGSSSLKTLILSEGLEELGEGVFANCTSLKNITLPSTLKEIQSRAFGGCSSLEKINFPVGIQKIGYGAFYACTALEDINISEYPNLTSIDGAAFDGCTSLKTVDLSKCSNLTDMGRYVFLGCTSLTSIKFPATIEEVDAGICWECTSLVNVEIPNTVTRICEGAFSGCASLERIVLPTSLKRIDTQAFANCDSLIEVAIPYGTETIDYSFQNCKSLQALYIPDTVTTLHKSVIRGSDNCIIYCTAGSEAASVCAKNSISYLTDNSVNSLITVLYNGKRVSFHAYNQNPEIVNDRTLVPLRAIFEAMNAEVEWDQETQTVTATRGNVTVKITIGDSKLYKNGEEIAVDVPAQLINDRTMVPARVIAEAFGANVEWNNNGRTVLITE